jgi:hypothetical protein
MAVRVSALPSSAIVSTVIAPVAGKQRAEWVETIHAPLPSAAADRLNRAVATTLASTVKDMRSS